MSRKELNKEALIKQLKAKMETKKCKADEEAEAIIICRKTKRVSSYRTKEKERLHRAIEQLEKEVEVFREERMNKYKENKAFLYQQAHPSHLKTLAYMRSVNRLNINLPEFIHYAVSKMIKKRFITRIPDPLQRYQLISENSFFSNCVTAKLSVLRLSLLHYDRKKDFAKPKYFDFDD